VLNDDDDDDYDVPTKIFPHQDSGICSLKCVDRNKNTQENVVNI